MLQSETVKKYDTYKDSWIEWIGEIPQEWKFAKLAWCSNFVNGYAFNSENMDIEGEVPVVRIGDIQNNRVQYETCLKVDSSEELKPYELKVNDIVIAMSGATTGKLAVICDEKQAYINQRVGIIRSKYNKFIRYCLDNESFMKYVALLSAGSAQPNISMSNILDYKIPYISVEEQQQIADYLDKKCEEIDRVVETEKAVIEKLKEYKQSIVTEAVTKGLDKSAPLKDSGIEYLGNIPNNWNIKRLRHLANCQNGISKGGEFFGEGSPFVSYGDVYNNNVLPEIVSGLCMVTDSEKENYSVRENDIFFTRTSETIEEIAITCVCKKTIPDATFAGFLIRVRPYTDELLVDFSKYYFASEIHRKFFVKEMNLVIRASLSQELLKKLPVLIPSKEEQQQIAEYLDKKCSEIDKAIADKEQVIEKFTEYKKSLIYECVTGKRKVV